LRLVGAGIPRAELLLAFARALHHDGRLVGNSEAHRVESGVASRGGSAPRGRSASPVPSCGGRGPCAPPRPLEPAVGGVAGPDDDDVGDGAVADPFLVAVEDPVGCQKSGLGR
jgi:hypothetical protein